MNRLRLSEQNLKPNATFSLSLVLGMRFCAMVVGSVKMQSKRKQMQSTKNENAKANAVAKEKSKCEFADKCKSGSRANAKSKSVKSFGYFGFLANLRYGNILFALRWFI